MDNLDPTLSYGCGWQHAQRGIMPRGSSPEYEDGYKAGLVCDRAGNPKKPMMGRCGNETCEHEFVIVFLPMEMSRAADVMRTCRCPMCGGSKVLI